MHHEILQKSQQSFAPRSGMLAAAGSMTQGQALSFRPAVAGILRVKNGRAWATLDIGQGSSPAECGDLFLLAGQDLLLRAGQRVVLESWPHAGGCAAELAWEPQGRDLAPLRKPGEVGGRSGLAQDGVQLARAWARRLFGGSATSLP